MSEMIQSTNPPSHFIYLIEDVVEFSPADNSLYAIEKNEDIPLFTPASECFLALIQHHGNLVTKNKLIFVGWESYGLHASDSTFYQNILTLRKALRKGGLTKDIVKTIPRKGLLVPKTVKIVKTAPHPSKNRENIQQEAPVSTFVPAQDIESSPAKRGYKQRFVALFSVLVILMCTLLGFYDADRPDYLDSYTYLEKKHGCHIYIDSTQTSVEDFKQFSSTQPLSCPDNGFVYFSTNNFVQLASVIQCEHEISRSGGGKCISNYYLEKNQ